MVLLIEKHPRAKICVVKSDWAASRRTQGLGHEHNSLAGSRISSGGPQAMVGGEENA